MKILLMTCALFAISSPALADQPKAAPATAPAAEPPKLANGTQSVCPVTGEKFTVKDKTVQTVYNGKRYAFCCADCLPEFNKNPAKYAK